MTNFVLPVGIHRISGLEAHPWQGQLLLGVSVLAPDGRSPPEHLAYTAYILILEIERIQVS